MNTAYIDEIAILDIHTNLHLVLAVNSSLAVMDLFANELVAEHSKMHQYQLIDLHVLNQVQNNSIWLV